MTIQWLIKSGFVKSFEREHGTLPKNSKAKIV